MTYQCGEGTGSNYVVENIEAGTNHALVSFATAGFTAPSGYQFFKWQVGSSQHNPGDEITVNGNVTVTALYEPIPAETPVTPTKNAALPVGAIIGIAVGSTIVVGLGAFALVWFVFKKKSWADLVAVFKK